MPRRKLNSYQKAVLPVCIVLAVTIYILFGLRPVLAYHGGEHKQAFITDYEIVSRTRRGPIMWYELRIDGQKYEAQGWTRNAFQGDEIDVVKIGDTVSLDSSADVILLSLIPSGIPLLFVAGIGQELYSKRVFRKKIVPLLVGIFMLEVALSSLLLFG